MHLSIFNLGRRFVFIHRMVIIQCLNSQLGWKSVTRNLGRISLAMYGLWANSVQVIHEGSKAELWLFVLVKYIDYNKNKIAKIIRLTVTMVTSWLNMILTSHPPHMYIGSSSSSVTSCYVLYFFFVTPHKVYYC